MDLLSKDQFQYICKMLKTQGKKPTPENIAMYLKLNNNQIKKMARIIKEKKIDWQLKQVAFLQNLVFRIKLFGYWVVMYKRGIKGRFWKIEIVKSKEGHSERR